MSRRVLALLLAAVAVLAGCSSNDDGGPPVTVNSPSSASAFRGAVFSPARTLPDVTLTDTSGRKWNLADRAHDRLTVVYFGYTNCPDVCPTDMADIATARRSLPADVQDRLDVLFVTVDLQRDTAPVLRRWLDRFDPTFVGLRGQPNALRSAARALGVPYRTSTVKGLEQVEHGSLMTAFNADGTSRLAWLDGTPPSDIAHDVQLLADGQVPA
jgi:protein SCO1/2